MKANDTMNKNVPEEKLYEISKSLLATMFDTDEWDGETFWQAAWDLAEELKILEVKSVRHSIFNHTWSLFDIIENLYDTDQIA